MSFKIEFYPDKSYYEEAYNEIISTLKLKKYEPIFALVIIFFGITLFFINQNKNLSFISIIFIGIGIYEFMKYYYEKQKWINDRLKSKILGEKLEILSRN